MKPIFYSRSAEARASFVRDFVSQHPCRKLIYLAPRKFLGDVQRRIPSAIFLAYEDLTNSNDIFNLADDESLLVFDRPSRYKNITTDTWIRLSRAAERYQQKILVDIVPFTGEIKYLYCPLALISRTILGYQHWYSYRENNLEQLADGSIVRAHDYQVLARKLAPYCSIDYADFLGNAIQVVDCPLTAQEMSDYQELRDRLIEAAEKAGKTSISPIFTQLADWTNIRQSRYTKLRDILLQRNGQTMIYTNLQPHNRRLKKIFTTSLVRSFYDANGEEDQYDTIILFELPIVNGHLFLDILANVRPDCRIFFFKSNSGIDEELYKRMVTEYQSINDFAQRLYEEVSA
ncbi:hypothetical protein KSF_109730 [Reticulibacter mediterranei]|uniref:Uncharacterized protein n=1 Tax=Reticulibacter mediterranei TaxID=2778369 RepID=A0A8J3IYP3_9CHLR|nr:hypothetical protein [Reticulibacter mediterranei]GHP00926.1 hypothetical protein KSF_109730 [Reticulibacter mediterranei]